MNGKRFLKQLIYGSGYAVILLLIGFFIYNGFFKPAPTCSDGIKNQNEAGIDCGGPCPACEIKELFNLGVDQAQIKYFPADPDKKTTAFYFEIKNLNLNYGADSFTYMLDIFGESGTEIKNSVKPSFIYAGGIKHIVDIVNVEYDKIASVSLATADIKWIIKNKFPEPQTEVRGVETSTSADGAEVVVTGFAQNKEAYPLSKILVAGTLANRDKIKISASKTEIDNIPAFGETAFKLSFPKNISLASPEQKTTYNFAQDLKLGASGDDIKALQQLLQSETFFNQPITGQFDQATKNALIQYQKKSKISPASGNLDLKTRNYINALQKEMPAPLLTTQNLTKADPLNTNVFVEGIR